MIRFTLIWILLCGSVFGQASAVIEGPEKALPGELVVLNSSKSVGDNHKWITPEGISTAQAGCTAIDSQIFFATPRPGSYTFVLIVADKTAAIEYARHTVVIGNPIAPEPPPELPTDPPVTNPGDFSKLLELSKENANRLSDAATKTALAKSLRQVVNAMKIECANQRCPTLQAAQTRFVKAIEDTLLQRQGSSRNVDWEGNWRVPNARFLATQTFTSSAKYLEACEAITKGLE
jgi:hypothetical protein